MPTCPNGHQSAADDWCEVCGQRMTSAQGAPAGAVPPPQMPGLGVPPARPGGGYGYPAPENDSTMQAQLCPQCRTPREGLSPFCEECRYNFLTNTPTTFTSPPPPSPPSQAPGGSTGLNLPPGFQTGPPGPQPPQPGQPLDYERSRPSQVNRPAEPLAPEPQGPPPHRQQHQQQHQSQPQHQQQGPPDYAQQPGYGRPADYGQQSAVGAPPAQPGYGYPQPPQPPHHQPGQQPGGGGDDWTLPPAGRPAQPDYGQQPGYGYPQQQHQQPPHQHQQQPPHQQQHQQPQQPANWMVTIGPDREYFAAMMQRSGPEAAGLNLPAYSPEQRVQLTGPQVTIGRRRHSTGESPDIDLARPPEDPGVSHQHAVLVRQPDGNWAVVDQDSTNGTTVNGAEDPIQPFVPVPLQEGDRVHVGAWTTITLYRG
ncbi:FHA domain-containing protein [Streptomyces sp. TRM 70361]|uniref:FHA domain-containing protein n=1 Tax=Streptomyces sp. TRM 70361 TaxID=3116553 RepID=UPI002E7B3108|nr:FHA domain-containing protein [Streptomyces sp. TRM 70361]MEE1938063.1 FHA domain-containing protein [Streptomyces sp. TRM 70361]